MITKLAKDVIPGDEYCGKKITSVRVNSLVVRLEYADGTSDLRDNGEKMLVRPSALEVLRAAFGKDDDD